MTENERNQSPSDNQKNYSTGWLRFLAWFCPRGLFEGIEGDIVEQFEEDLQEVGLKLARRRRAMNVIRFLRPGIVLRNKFAGNLNHGMMIKNYVKTYRRNLAKNKIPSSLNLIGLMVGMTSVFLMTLFVQYELSYDTYPAHAENIYRVVFGENDHAGSVYSSQIIGTTLKETYPDVKAVRFNNAGNARVNFKYEDKQFMESAFFFTDPEALDVFSIPLAEGNSKTCLERPFTMVITRKAAEKFFGTENPMNKSLKIDWSGAFYDLEITGLIDEMPSNSHFTFDYLISIATAERIFQPQTFFTDWSANFCVTYLLIQNPQTFTLIEQNLTFLYKKHMNQDVAANTQLRLQPLKRIHLYSALSGELMKNADIKYVFIAIAIGLAVLIVSLINYTNILSALFTLRLKEVGIRKSLGAKRTSIMGQFLSESMINVMIGFLGAIVIMLVVSPWLTESFGKSWTIGKMMQLEFIWAGPLSVLLVGMAVGIYPSLLLANVGAGSILYGTVKRVLTSSIGKNFLVGLQLFIASLILVSALIIQKQLSFMETEDVGFTTEHMLSIPQGRIIREKSEYIKNEMSQTGKVISSSLSSHLPTRSLSFKAPAIVEGGNPNGTNEPFPMALISVDYDFFKTFNLKLLQGRTFSADFPMDSTQGFIINEAAVRDLHWDAPIGKEVQMTYNVGDGTVETRKGKVIGVIQDFHFESLHKSIEPLVMIHKPFWFYYASFRITPGDPASTVDVLRKKWESLVPNAPFDYTFMTDRLEQLYFTERSMAKGAYIFSGMAVGIAALGLFGLISFLIQSRMREIAVRKVLGADSLGIFGRLYGSIMMIVFVASLLAMPAAWYAGNQWLSGFAYHIKLDFDIFFISMLMVLGVSSLVIFGEIRKASQFNPVDILKSE